MRYVFFTVVLTLVFGITFLLARNGFFMPVEIALEDRPEMILVAKAHVGAYHKILPALQEVEAWAKEAGVDCSVSFGEFLDNPRIVEEERLNSRVGCVVERAPAAVPTGLEVLRKPARAYLVGRFSGSPALGPYKVYNKIDGEKAKRRLESDGAPLELYRQSPEQGFETTYLFPVKPSP